MPLRGSISTQMRFHKFLFAIDIRIENADGTVKNRLPSACHAGRAAPLQLRSRVKTGRFAKKFHARPKPSPGVWGADPSDG